MKAIRVAAVGGPEVLRVEEVPTPELGPGQVRVKVESAGVNYIDVYHRTGLYANPLPFIPGLEGAGVVQGVGEGVADVKKGDRVAWSNLPGSYAEEVVGPAERVVPVPAGLELRTAAALMLQGMTAQYLTESTFPLKAGHTCLLHAAAGGVGLLLAQMARQRGARIIGTVSTEEKAVLARQAGVHDVVLYTKENFLAAVKRLTDGRGVDVVYDSVGVTTFDKSLDCLAPRGMLVLFGQSSGPVPPFNISQLAAKGSLFLTRPTLFAYTADRASLLARASAVLDAAAAGTLHARIDRTFPLADAAEAHRALEARKTTGKALLIP